MRGDFCLFCSLVVFGPFALSSVFRPFELTCALSRRPPVVFVASIQGKNGIPLLALRKVREVELIMNDASWLK